MNLRDHEIDFADEIASRVLTGLLEASTAEALAPDGDRPVWEPHVASPNSAHAPPLNSEEPEPEPELSEDARQLTVALSRAELLNVRLTEALAAANDGILVLQRVLDRERAEMRVRSLHGEETLKQLFTLTPMPIDGGQRTAYPLSTGLIVRLRKMQQHIDEVLP